VRLRVNIPSLRGFELYNENESRHNYVGDQTYARYTKLLLVEMLLNHLCLRVYQVMCGKGIAIRASP
jgi:hypothetical protein